MSEKRKFEEEEEADVSVGESMDSSPKLLRGPQMAIRSVPRNFTGGPPKNYPGGDGGGGAPASHPSSKLTFKDCGGLETQIKYIKTAILNPLTDSGCELKGRFGLKSPKGVLFHGPPGTGKTRLALALSNEMRTPLRKHVHFIYRKGKDVASKFFGQSSNNLRRVFQEAIANKPSIIFFDELDGLCPRRDTAFAHQANVTIVTTMLGLMDELPAGQVLVIGATNCLDTIDPALRRPGRFDKHLEFHPPTQPGRLRILQIHTSSWKKKPSADLLKLMSDKTAGFSGADLAKLCLDAFDNALSRVIFSKSQAPVLATFRGANMNNFSPNDEDWNNALAKMRPSIRAAFGSSLYTPNSKPSDHYRPLMEEMVDKITTAICQQLPSTKAFNITTQSSIKGLHVFSQTGNLVGGLDDILLAEVLRSSRLDKYAIYSITCESLCSLEKNKCPEKIVQAFNQAVDSPQATILYIPQVDVLGEQLSEVSLGSAINLQHQIERLRGKYVIMLTTGSAHPMMMTPHNVFKNVVLANQTLEALPPRMEARAQFFSPIFDRIFNSTKKKWTKAEEDSLANLEALVVRCTEGKDLQSIMILYNKLEQVALKVREDNVAAITAEIMGIIGAYRQNP